MQERIASKQGACVIPESWAGRRSFFESCSWAGRRSFFERGVPSALFHDRADLVLAGDGAGGRNAGARKRAGEHRNMPNQMEGK